MSNNRTLSLSAPPRVTSITTDGCLVEWSPVKAYTTASADAILYRVQMSKNRDTESKMVSCKLRIISMYWMTQSYILLDSHTLAAIFSGESMGWSRARSTPSRWRPSVCQATNPTSSSSGPILHPRYSTPSAATPQTPPAAPAAVSVMPPNLVVREDPVPLPQR